MSKTIAALLSVGACVPLMWFDAVPHGVALCASDTPFNTVSDTDSNRAAAMYAKAKFCAVVASFPI